MEQAPQSSSYWHPTLDSHSTTSIPLLLCATTPLGDAHQRTGDHSWADCWDDGSKWFVFPDRRTSLSVIVSFNCHTWTFFWLFNCFGRGSGTNTMSQNLINTNGVNANTQDYLNRVKCTVSGLSIGPPQNEWAAFCHGNADTCRSATLGWFAYRSWYHQRRKCKLVAFCNRWLQFADSESTLVSLWAFFLINRAQPFVY